MFKYWQWAWMDHARLLIAGMLCERGEGVLFEWNLCMTFTRVPSSAYKGYGLLCSALSSGERDCFLWKWMWKNFWYWCFLYKTSEEPERHLIWSLKKRASSLSLMLFCYWWSLCRGHLNSFSFGCGCSFVCLFCIRCLIWSVMLIACRLEREMAGKQ